MELLNIIQKPSGENAPSQKPNDLANAIRIVRQGCDMTAFGDALQYQIKARQDRDIPGRD